MCPGRHSDVTSGQVEVRAQISRAVSLLSLVETGSLLFCVDAHSRQSGPRTPSDSLVSASHLAAGELELQVPKYANIFGFLTWILGFKLRSSG